MIRVYDMASGRLSEHDATYGATTPDVRRQGPEERAPALQEIQISESRPARERCQALAWLDCEALIKRMER